MEDRDNGSEFDKVQPTREDAAEAPGNQNSRSRRTPKKHVFSVTQQKKPGTLEQGSAIMVGETGIKSANKKIPKVSKAKAKAKAVTLAKWVETSDSTAAVNRGRDTAETVQQDEAAQDDMTSGQDMVQVSVGIVEVSEGAAVTVTRDSVANPAPFLGSIPTWVQQLPRNNTPSTYQSPYAPRNVTKEVTVEESNGDDPSETQQTTRALPTTSNDASAGEPDTPSRTLQQPVLSHVLPMQIVSPPRPVQTVQQSMSSTDRHTSSIPLSTSSIFQSVELPLDSSSTQAVLDRQILRPLSPSYPHPSMLSPSNPIQVETSTTNNTAHFGRASLTPGISSNVHSRNAPRLNFGGRQDSPGPSQHSSGSTPASGVQKTLKAKPSVTKPAALRTVDDDGKFVRRTAKEMDALHRQRDMAGLPRLRQYPKNMVIVPGANAPLLGSPQATPEPAQLAVLPRENDANPDEDSATPVAASSPKPTTKKRGRPRKNVDESSDLTPKKRGRPKKMVDDILDEIDHDILPVVKKGRPRKRLLNDLNNTPDGQEQPRKKRAYNKKSKPTEQDAQQSGVMGSPGNSWTPGVVADQYSSHNMQQPSLYPEEPSMYTNSGFGPRSSFYEGQIDPQLLSDNALHDSGMKNASAVPMDNRDRGNKFGIADHAQSRAITSDEEEEDDEDDEDDVEDDDEDSAVYGNIMSQVSKITGKAPVKRGRGLAKQGLEDFLNFTDAEVEEEEDEPEEEEQPAPQILLRGIPQPKRTRRVRRRGPRSAAEPTGEIKMRLGLANEAFSNSDMVEARRLVDEIIRINAETHEAWNLLSSICQEQDDTEGALMALIVAAHLRPKHVAAWFNAVDYALTSMGPVTPRLLREAEFCLGTCIRQVPHSVEARLRKSQILAQRGAWNRAATDYKHVLRYIPYDLQVIRELGEVYVDLGDGVAGLELFHSMLENYKQNPELYELSIDWNHANVLAQLWTFVEKKGEEALKEVKALARYLLGRENEDYWEDVIENDCEWDLDDTRRLSLVQYSPEAHPSSAYGEGLPIEIRVCLGKYRLSMGHHIEAIHHFNQLLSIDSSSGEEYKFLYPEMFIHIGDLFEHAGKISEALLFYRAVKEVPNENTAQLCLSIGKCCLRDDRTKEAEESFREACLLDNSNIQARVELARLYERLDEAEQAFDYVSQILELEKNNRIKLYGAHNLPVRPAVEDPRIRGKPGRRPQVPPRAPVKRPKKVVMAPATRDAIAEALRHNYVVLKEKTAGMREGRLDATDYWMDAAKALTEDFRSCKAFYPWDRKEFDGYTKDEQHRAEQNLNLDVKVLSQMHGQNIGNNKATKSTGIGGSEVPVHYRGVSFDEWAEIFGEYAVALARRGRGREAYDIVESATHAMCFCFDKQAMYRLHMTYALCALMSNDEETCVAMARWFMFQYQFATDSYRMFAALMRMCHSPISWYCAGPTQKFILRQIKTADYAVANETRAKVIERAKAAYTHMDGKGKPIINKELDVSLLMIYGHILIAGASYLYGLNYFHRALALDPGNPIIALSLGLSYMQYALKRQIDNRQYAITQGVTYMNKYYHVRSQSPHFEERQEAHYNLARAYHLVGLTSLALPLYKKVLKAEGRKRKELSGYAIDWKAGSDDEDEEADGKRAMNEDMCLDAAYNLQIIYTVAGNVELAQKITRKWLVI